MVKNIYILLSLSLGITTSIISQQKVDTSFIQKIVEANPVLKSNNFNSSSFRITVFDKLSSDTSKMVFEIISNEKWNKINNPYKGYFTGLIINNSKFYFNGDFIYSVMNYKNIPVSTSGTYLFDKLYGFVNVRTPDFFISKTMYKKDLKDGLNLLYFGDKIESVNEISFYVNDTLNGERYLFYNNGILKESSKYVKGQKDGIFLTYYSNGKDKIKLEYKCDIPIGNSKEFFENGGLKSVGQFSGNYIIAEIECDTCNQKKFIFRDKLGKSVDILLKYSVEFRKELGQSMKEWNLKEKIKYPLKKGVWTYYNEDGTINKKVFYDKNGNALLK